MGCLWKVTNECSATRLIPDLVIGGEAMRSKAAVDEKDVEQLVFRCTTCNFVLKQVKGGSPPSYCPNCAIQHLGGEMVPEPEDAAGEQTEGASEGSRAVTGSKAKRFS